MEATIHSFKFNLSTPLDISIPLSNTPQNPIAWYLDKPIIEPVTLDNWTGKVTHGSSTNFNTITFNPHAHGTHTECLGHITTNFYSINKCLQNFFFTTFLISVSPVSFSTDLIITKQIIEQQLSPLLNTYLFPEASGIEAVVIRTLPNIYSKRNKNYSHTNPPYLSEEAAQYLVSLGVKHLLIDLPSIDKEKDQGKLLAHKAFWNITTINPINPSARIDCTITEMVYVDNAIADGFYLLNLQIAPFENDASPSKPILYPLKT